MVIVLKHPVDLKRLVISGTSILPIRVNPYQKDMSLIHTYQTRKHEEPHFSPMVQQRISVVRVARHR